MKIGIIAAMEVEFNNLLDGMESYEEYKILGIKFYDGILNDKEVTLSLSGIGKVNAALACGVLINDFKCNFIINTGIAGGTKPLNPKDVIIGNSICYHDFDLRVFGYKYGQVPHMPQEFFPGDDAILLVKRSLKKIGIDYKVAKIYSGDKFVTSLDDLVPNNYEGCCFEMEGAAIAHVCIKSGTDFIILRYISDIIGEKSQIDNYFEFETEMANRSASITLELLREI